MSTPPAEREASGGPLEGAKGFYVCPHVGRAEHRSGRGNQKQMRSTVSKTRFGFCREASLSRSPLSQEAQDARDTSYFIL